MTVVVALADLAPWPDPDVSNAAAEARHRLLAVVAAQLDIVSRPTTPREWQLATVPVDALPDLRSAVDAEGRRTDRHQVAVAGRTRWQSVPRHAARVRRKLLVLIDRHLREAGS